MVGEHWPMADGRSLDRHARRVAAWVLGRASLVGDGSVSAAGVTVGGEEDGRVAPPRGGALCLVRLDVRAGS